MLLLSKDVAATARAYAAGRFTDPKRRSHFSIAGHEFLRGADRVKRWEELYVLRKGKCEACGLPRKREQLDLDHKGSRPRTRCDCLDTVLADGSLCTGIRLLCTMDVRRGARPGSCHSLRHNREVQFRKVAAKA